MKRSVISALVIALAATAWILSGHFGPLVSREPSEPPAAAPNAEEPPVEVRVQRFTSRDYRSHTIVTGRTEAARSVPLRAQTTGPIEEIGAPEGSTVEEGELIARIANRARDARLTEAKALVAQRRAELVAGRDLARKGHRSKTQVAAEQAAYDQAIARLKQIEVEIADTHIRAPFAGVLEERMVEIGDYVEPGDEIATIVDLDPILIVASVSERAVGGLSVGAPGRATLITGQEVEGRLRYIGSVADPGTRTFKVELEVSNSEGLIRSGLTAELTLPGETVSAHQIPSSALTLSDGGQVGVKTVDSAGIVAFRPVEILSDEPDGSWVTGLPDTVELIVVGQEFAAEGQRVRTQLVTGESS